MAQATRLRQNTAAYAGLVLRAGGAPAPQVIVGWATCCPPYELSRTPSEIRTATPECGEHTDEVMHELGYSDGEIADLRKRIVI